MVWSTSSKSGHTTLAQCGARVIRWICVHIHVEGAPTVPSTTLLEIPPEEQGQMRAILRRTRYGYLLAFHILLLCAVGRVALQLTVVTNTSARSGVAAPVQDVHAASAVPSVTAAHETPTIRVPSSNGP